MSENGQLFQMNRAARSVILDSVQEKQALKRKTVDELAACVNEICEALQIRYFAEGELLTWCMAGEDTYPDLLKYRIAMLRADYEQFMKAAKKTLKEKGIRLQFMYGRDGVIRSRHTKLVMERSSKNEEEYLSCRIELEVEPLDFLPDDAGERDSFLEKIRNENRLYQKRSSLVLKAGSIRDKGIRKINRVLNPNRFVAYYKKYSQLIRTYDREEQTGHVGRIELLTRPALELKDAFPAGRQPFLDSYLYVPARPDLFMPREQEEQQAWLLEKRVETLKRLHEVCTACNIEYSLMGELSGSCTRASDYDDDSKSAPWYIGLLRRDYEILLEALEKEDCPLYLYDHLDDNEQIHAEHVKLICAEKEAFSRKDDRQAVILIPLDALPDENYDKAMDFLREVRDQAAVLRHVSEMEKGAGSDSRLLHTDSFKEYDRLQKLCGRYSDHAHSDRIFTIMDYKPKLYVRTEIFPAVLRPFHGFAVYGPQNPYLWHRENEDAYIEYLTAKRTEILKIFDKMCEKEDIQYFAIRNLLIGASIYHDYVPGEEGTFDVAMLRDDYEKAISLLREKAASLGLSLNEYRDEKGRYPLMTRTLSFPGGMYTKTVVRLMPFDKVPEDFYLYNGFVEDIKKKNADLEELLNSFTYGVDVTLVKNPFTRALKKQAARRRIDRDELRQELANTRQYFNANPEKNAEEIRKLAQSFNDDERTHSYARVELGFSKTITEAELFPLQRVKFRDMYLSCPKDYSVWQPMLNAELERQVSCLQKADLILLQEMDRVCRELDIGYFVCGGTMLGYMRHKGFIPWDDDVDVAMLRADYDRFLKEAPAVLDERFFLQTRESDPNNPYLFSKIRMNDTEYITAYNEHRNFHKGVCLDLFPFDYLPSHPDKCQAFLDEIYDQVEKHYDIARHQLERTEEGAVVPRNDLERRYRREQEERLKKYWSKDLKDSQKTYLDIVTRYNADAKKNGLTIVASFVPTFTFIDLNDLLPYQRGTFEGVEISVPKRPDIFLTMQYGDYMQLPPLHMQVAHRLVRWSTWTDSWDRPPKPDDEA